MNQAVSISSATATAATLVRHFNNVSALCRMLCSVCANATTFAGPLGALCIALRASCRTVSGWQPATVGDGIGPWQAIAGRLRVGMRYFGAAFEPPTWTSVDRSTRRIVRLPLAGRWLLRTPRAGGGGGPPRPLPFGWLAPLPPRPAGMP